MTAREKLLAVTACIEWGSAALADAERHRRGAALAALEAAVETIEGLYLRGPAVDFILCADTIDYCAAAIRALAAEVEGV